MNKQEDRRTAIAERLADHILEHGLIASSLRPLAQAAGTSDRMLLYYFEDKAEIIAVALQTVAGRMAGLMAAAVASEPLPYDQLLPKLAVLLSDEGFWPYMRIWLEIASRAAGGDPFYAKVGEEIGRGFLAWGRAQLKAEDDEALDRDAARLLLAIEGGVLLKSIGLGDVAARAIN
jgi:AcrR family transcriptional regulator